MSLIFIEQADVNCDSSRKLVLQLLLALGLLSTFHIPFLWLAVNLLLLHLLFQSSSSCICTLTKFLQAKDTNSYIWRPCEASTATYSPTYKLNFRWFLKILFLPFLIELQPLFKLVVVVAWFNSYSPTRLKNINLLHPPELPRFPLFYIPLGVPFHQ